MRESEDVSGSLLSPPWSHLAAVDVPLPASEHRDTCTKATASHKPLPANASHHPSTPTNTSQHQPPPATSHCQSIPATASHHLSTPATTNHHQTPPANTSHHQLTYHSQSPKSHAFISYWDEHLSLWSLTLSSGLKSAAK